MSGRMVRRPRGITRVLFRGRRLRSRQQRPPRSEGAARLRAFAYEEIEHGQLVVVADAQPYAHAIEPMLHACGGLWIRRATAIAPRTPDYVSRRVRIEDALYAQHAAFANEGLAALCHTAFEAPVFRASDWSAYQDVNEIFAHAAVATTPRNGIVILHDRQLALAPKLVRDEEPQLTTALFWHSPWPNPEIAALCPWRDAVLQGMIGADVVGFQTRTSALHFLETVRRALECRVDVDSMSIRYRGRRTFVRVYPSSIDWPFAAAPRGDGLMMRRELGIPLDAHVVLTIGETPSVDGAVFVPLPDARDARYYAMADTALFAPKRNGMTLAAKEYAGACEDGNGALVLSAFDDAAKELEQALLVNPYDAAEVAQAVRRAMRMPLVERRMRMEAMRKQIAASSAYDWSEKLLRDLCAIRAQRLQISPYMTNSAREATM